MVRFLNWFGKRREYEIIGDGDSNREESSIKDYDEFVSYNSLWRYATSADIFWIFFSILCTISAAICQPIYVMLVGNTIGDFINYAIVEIQHSMNESEQERSKDTLYLKIDKFVISMIILGIAILFLNYISGIVWSSVSFKQMRRIRQQTMEKILYQDIAWFESFRIGEFTSTFSRNLANMEDGISENIPAFIYHEMVFLSGIFLSLLLGWELTIICIASLPACLLFKETISKVTRSYSETERESYNAAKGVAKEIFSAIRTVVAFGGEEKELERFKSYVTKVQRINIRKSMFNGIGEGFLYFFLYSCCSIAFWFAVRLIREGRMLNSLSDRYNTGYIIAILYISWIACWNFYRALPLINVIAIASGAAETVFAQLEANPKINSALNYGLRPVKCVGHISFKQVYFHYPSQTSTFIINGISLNIQPKETVGFVGASLAFFQLLQRFYDPTFGEILIDANSLRDLNLTEWRKQLALVESSPFLFDGTISENIRNGRLNACQADIEKSAKTARIHKFIKKLPKGYNTQLGRNGMSLNTEQIWRLGLARALIRMPSILLIDATSPQWAKYVAEAESGMSLVTQNCTCIIIADRLYKVKEADRIIIFSEGYIQEQGSYEKLMNGQEIVTPLFKKQPDEDKDLEEDEIFEDESTNREKLEVSSKNDDVREEVGIFDLLKICSSEWTWIVFGALCSIVIGASIPITTMILAEILGSIYIQNSMTLVEIIKPLCWQFVFIGIIYGTAFSIQNYAFESVREKLTTRLMTDMFNSILHQEIDWFEQTNNNVDKICTKLINDVTLISMLPGLLIGVLTNHTTTILLANAISYFYQPSISLLLLIPLTFTVLVYYKISQVKFENGELREVVLKEYDKVADEAIEKIKTISTLGLERTFLQKLVEIFDRKYRRKKIHMANFCMGITRSFVPLAYAVGFFYGTLLMITNGNLTYEKIILVTELQISGLWAIGQIFGVIPTFHFGSKIAKRVFAILDRTPQIQSIFNASKRNWENLNVEFCNVYFTDPTKKQISVLNGFNLKVPAGKTVSILDTKKHESSLIIEILQRFHNIQRGEITIDDIDISIIDLKYLRANLGVIFRKPDILNRTIYENIAYGDNNRNVSIEEVVKAAKIANIHDFVISLPLGYATRVGFRGILLSKNQKQCIAIARIVIKNPKILLLDEPNELTSNDTENVVKNALNKITANRTCIITTSNISNTKADLICYIHKGTIREAGTHSELLEKRGYYYKLYEAQFF